jgi:hypothetical protein
VDWVSAQQRLRSPIFAPLAIAMARLPAQRWPDHADLNAAAAGIVTAMGVPLRFVNPREHSVRERRYYELRVAETGEVGTRPQNWHDLLNALVWMTFPAAKAQINAQHAAMLKDGGEAEAKHRSPERDALTLFDEGGVAVASSSPELMRLIIDFEWKQLFWSRRAQLAGKMRFFGFGHGMYEQALNPYIGMVAKTVFVPASEVFFSLPLAGQLAQVDALLADHFTDRSLFRSPRMMAPMPVLGVPGWYPPSEIESFYDDPVHFRSKGPRRQ